MLVRNWMTHDPVSVPSATPLIEAYRILKEYEIRHLPVVDGGRVVGIITDHDLGRAVLELVDAGIDSPVSVAQIMSHPAKTVGPDDPIETAAMLMHNHKLGGLPVIGPDGRLAGILTVQDLLEVLISELTEKSR